MNTDADTTDLRPGSRLGNYRLLERLGAGGMGEVFKALHVPMQRVVAVKVMAPGLVADPRSKARFLREVYGAARLQHPNIVMAYDAEVNGDRCFLVMEYVEGRDAGALLQAAGPAPVRAACEVIRQAALGLHHAYEQGVLHRDIKPGNLIVASGRGAAREPGAPAAWPADPVVKILDLGLVRLAEAEGPDGHPLHGSTPLTREGFVVGTPEFMSPEQATNSTLVDIRSDIYSLGCTLYCLLTGRPPFSGNSLIEIMVQHLQTLPEPVSARRADVPPGVTDVLGRMLAKKPEQRYQTPAEVAAALSPHARPAAVTAPPTPKPVAIPVLRPPDPPTEVLTPPPAPAMVAPEFRPERGPETGFFASVGRAVVGCLGLFLVLIATMILAWLFLFNTPPDDAAPPPATRKTEAPGGG